MSKALKESQTPVDAPQDDNCVVLRINKKLSGAVIANIKTRLRYVEHHTGSSFELVQDND